MNGEQSSKETNVDGAGEEDDGARGEGEGVVASHGSTRGGAPASPQRVVPWRVVVSCRVSPCLWGGEDAKWRVRPGVEVSLAARVAGCGPRASRACRCRRHRGP